MCSWPSGRLRRVQAGCGELPSGELWEVGGGPQFNLGEQHSHVGEGVTELSLKSSTGAKTRGE